MDASPEIRRRLPRAERAERAGLIADLHGGVAHRTELRLAGVSRADVRSEVDAGRWSLAGRHTVVIGTGGPAGEGLMWRAVWETGAGAALDGVAALMAAGMTGFAAERIDVSQPRNNRRRKVDGVTRHSRVRMPPLTGAGIARVRPEWAMIHAAEWAVSDRQAALLVCLPLQQRLVHAERLLAVWGQGPRGPRQAFLDAVIRDVCDGAQSLGELDFARLCRRRGLPEPSRQVVVCMPDGRLYLDVAWDGLDLVVEIDGGHHALALAPVDDALRQNDVVLSGAKVLRIPVLGLRLSRERFMDQVVRGHEQAERRAA